MGSDLPTSAARFRRLEREHSRMRILLAGCMLLAVTLLLSGHGRRPEVVVRAERFELVGPDGARRAILAADTLGFAMTLLDERGRPAGALRLTREPRLVIQSGRGEEVAGLGAPRVRHLTE